tara:strand:+ start:2629 stop:3006 length:378 start_codon:yes stop_codon:yes gene_type:complete
MSSTNISIKQLPQITEINNNDLLLVQTSNATNTLKFENFVVGLENTTFATTISANATDIDSISSIISETFFVKESTLGDGPDLLTNETTSQTKSAFDTSLLPINITQGGSTRTFYFLLSAGPFIV